MSRYNGLIIPRSYNDYFSRSDPADLLRLVQQTTDAELDPNSTNPLQNQAIAQIVPNAATPENPLTDRNFVNSTVGTNTANYIYKTNAGDENVPFDSIAELEAYSGTVTQNDYAFVTGIDENGNKYFDRYKANVDGSVITWAKEYRLNNSSFTAEQWAAIQSGITAAKVTQFEQGIVPSNANACICTTGATTAAKTGTAPSSFVLAAGAKISVLFTNASQTNRPTLNINGKGAKNIKVYQHGTKINLPNHTINNVVTYWQAGTTLDLIYDGTDWVVMGNPVVASNASASSGYTVYANGLIKQSGVITINSGDYATWKRITYSIPLITCVCAVAVVPYDSNNSALNTQGATVPCAEVNARKITTTSIDVSYTARSDQTFPCYVTYQIIGY